MDSTGTNSSSTSPSSPAALATNAGGLKSSDGRYEVLKETDVWSHRHFGKVIQRDVRDNAKGTVQDQLLWNRDKHFVITALIAPVAPGEGGKKMIWVKEEFKLGVMNTVLTSAAGGIKKDETARKAASRELWEEFGILPVSLEQIGDPLSELPDKITGSSQTIFLATDISQTKEDPEEGQIRKFPLTKEGVTDLLKATTVVLHKLAIYEALRASGNIGLLV